MLKYHSPSTPTISHDLMNFLVEAILINRYGTLPAAAWRKGRPLAQEWGKLLVKVKRITKTLDVQHEQLAWYIQFFKITDLDYKDFGLLRWKIKRYFKWCNVDKFVSYYTNLHAVRIQQLEINDYAEETKGYKTKPQSANRQKTLSEILRELEDERGCNSEEDS